MRKINSAIRLTESELKSIVCESVKKCLNEINWQTYRNALEKNRDNEGAYRKAFDDLYNRALEAEKNGDDELATKLRRKARVMYNKMLRGFEFYNAAVKSFNDEHFSSLYKDVDKGKIAHMPFYQTDGEDHKVDGKWFDDEISLIDTTNHDYRDNKRDKNISINGSDIDDETYRHLRKNRYTDSQIEDIDNANRDIRNYRNGNYQFDKKKGWHLKDE